MNLLATILVITNIGYTAAFDTVTRCPSWVYYELDASKIVKAERQHFKFEPDPQIYLEYQDGLSLGYDYATNAGWDRGHMAPAADFNWNTNALRQTYYYSNICPMARHVNRGEWRKIEDAVRKLAESGTVHVITFPVYARKWTCCGGPCGSSAFPDGFVKFAWGSFGVRMWSVENERNDNDTK